MRRISKDITKHYQMACSSGELHAISFLWAHVFYVLILPFFYGFFVPRCVANILSSFRIIAATTSICFIIMHIVFIL